jgi:hypothetical protein
MQLYRRMLRNQEKLHSIRTQRSQKRNKEETSSPENGSPVCLKERQSFQTSQEQGIPERYRRKVKQCIGKLCQESSLEVIYFRKYCDRSK